jgi:hypothetical protein
MVLQSLCAPSPMEKNATPNGVMAQWWAYSGSSDIQNTVLLTSWCRYQFPATNQSFEQTPSSLLRLCDFHVTYLRFICEVWWAQWHVCPRVNIPGINIFLFLGLYNGLSIPYVSVSFQPFVTWSCFLASTLSRRLSLWMTSLVTGKCSICDMWNTSSRKWYLAYQVQLKVVYTDYRH